MGKFAGAIGNYNAHLVAYPDINWPKIAEEFVTSLGLSFNPYVTQIEPHDYIVEFFMHLANFHQFRILTPRVLNQILEHIVLEATTTTTPVQGT
ncbi:hypothetical protein GBA52_009110 [Prunus armeniaca]|nr:hypothetical protein GBA52_009110 [Prunus armeniaca]